MSEISYTPLQSRPCEPADPNSPTVLKRRCASLLYGISRSRLAYLAIAEELKPYVEECMAEQEALRGTST